jgi:hypothetical protein
LFDSWPEATIEKGPPPIRAPFESCLDGEGE